MTKQLCINEKKLNKNGLLPDNTVPMQKPHFVCVDTYVKVNIFSVVSGHFPVLSQY